MKKSLFLLAMVAVLTIVNATVITGWDFEAGTIDPSSGSGSLALIGGVNSDGVNPGSGYPSNTGYAWRTTNYPAQGTNNLSAGLYIEVSTLGFTDISLSWVIRHSNTSANKGLLFYTPDRTADPVLWYPVAEHLATGGDAWFAGSYDGAAETDLNNNPLLAFKLVAAFANPENTAYVASRSSSTYNPTGNWRFDNLMLEGSPAIPWLGIDASLTTFFATVGAISPIQTYIVNGQNLVSSITITAPQYFKLRTEGTQDFLSSLVVYPRNGTLNATIQVTFQPILGGDFSGVISHSGTGIDSIDLSVSGSTLIPEPSSYPTGFSANNITYYQAWLSWIDATGTIPPGGYLIKGSKVSADEIIDPVDGVPEEDKKLTKNVAFGVQTQLIFELNEEHTYYFKIYPYTNSGTAINYKADVDAPLISFTTSSGPEGSSLFPADIAFVEYASDSPDRFSFVLLTDVLENTKIYFTDKAWSGTAFADGEEVYLWRGVGRPYQKGEVIHIEEGILHPDEGIYNPDFEGFSNNGDQIIAFQGLLTEPDFLAAFSTTGWLSSGVTTNSSSYLPDLLVLGETALGFASEVDNGFYNGIVSGTADALCLLINNPANWTRNNSLANITFPQWEFEIDQTLASPEVLIQRIDETIIRISWGAVAGANTYEIFASTDPYLDWELLAVTGAVFQFDLTLDASSPDYRFFKVIASD